MALKIDSAALRAGALVSLLISLSSGCSSGPPVRAEILETLNRVSSGLKHGDPGESLTAYSEDAIVRELLADVHADVREDDGVRTVHTANVMDRDAYGRLLGRRIGELGAIEKAKYVLDEVREVDGGYEVDAWFNLYAEKDADRYHEESWHRFFVEPRDGEFLIRKHDVLDRTEVEGSERQFVDRTTAAGLAGRHAPYVEIDESTPIIPNNFSGSGASAGDLDGDGFLDLLVGDGKRSRLYRNRGDGTFEERTERLGASPIGGVRGAYVVDLDDDGALDLFFTRIKLPPVLLRNRGDFRFEDVSHALPPLEAGEGQSAAFGDLDGDGDLDVFIVRYGDYAKSGWATPLYDAVDGEPGVCLRNDGGLSFSIVDDPVLTPKGWGLAAAMADYDDDGDQDIYLVNDFGVNHLLRNDGEFRFTNVSEAAGVSDQGFGMSAAFGDYDGDGDLDIFVANMHSSARWVFDESDFPLPFVADLLFLRPYISEEMRKMTRGNSLFENGGDGTFRQVAAAMGVERAGWAWGANFLDHDNDGDLDILCPNGFYTGQKPDDL